MTASKILTDANGSYDLSQVAAVSPMTFRDRSGQVTNQPALLTLTSGRRVVTATAYKDVLAQWQVVASPPAAPAPAPAAA